MLYIDPGSGQLLWQIVVAAVLGFTFRFRNLFSKAGLSRFLRREARNENPSGYRD